MGCLLDTNVLLRGLDRSHPQYRAVRRAIVALRRRESRLFLAPQNLVEFWVVATRPKVANGLGLTVLWAAAQLTRRKRFFTLLTESPESFAEWERLVVQHQVSGKKAHDARIVAIMNVPGIARILTLNPEDFARYPGITVIQPQSIAPTQK